MITFRYEHNNFVKSSSITMAQIFDPLPNNTSDKIVCCYVNATSKMQIARITNIPNWYFERVVFPGQRLVFEAVSSAQLEIHCGMMASAILSDTIPCERLRIDDDHGEPEAQSDAEEFSYLGNAEEPLPAHPSAVVARASSSKPAKPLAMAMAVAPQF
jgi:hypothetical protein